MVFILESTYIQYSPLHFLELKAYLENQQKDFSFLFRPRRQTRHPEPVGGENTISLSARKSQGQVGPLLQTACVDGETYVQHCSSSFVSELYDMYDKSFVKNEYLHPQTVKRSWAATVIGKRTLKKS
jgi:hypothetical protein